jgi:hypothetical protein
MENYEFNEDASGEGGRRYKKDTTKRTLGTSIFNGAYLADRIAKLFTSDDITEEGVRTAQSYALYVKKGRIGLNFDSMEDREETMNANLPELIKQSYRILHDPRDNGNKMEFTYSLDIYKIFKTKFTILINFEDKRFELVDGEFVSECFPTPMDDESAILDDRNTLINFENQKSFKSFSPEMNMLLSQSSGGVRVGSFLNQEIQYEISKLVIAFLLRMFSTQIVKCDEVSNTFDRKRTPFNKIGEGFSRMKELMRLFS